MTMQTFTVQITNDNAVKALQELQAKHYIKIISKTNLDSPALPGKPLSPQQLKELVLSREQGPSMSLKEARAKWNKRMKQILKHAK
jgi:hypothetical protein